MEDKDLIKKLYRIKELMQADFGQAMLEIKTLIEEI